MLRKNLSFLPAVFVLTLLVLLIGPIPAGAKGVPPASGAHGPAAPVRMVPARACSSWTQVKSPSPSSTGSFLQGVVAPTTSFAWAVGFAYGDTGSGTLILQWNGTSWTQVASPNPSRLNFLYSVTGNAQDAWAVGYSGNGNSQNTLTEHWNGSQWSVIKSPGSGFLHGVAMVSSNDVWAVGTVIEHWNGSSWKVVKSPGGGVLYGVTAASSSDVWAVGTAIKHWDGSQWSITPHPGGSHRECMGGWLYLQQPGSVFHADLAVGWLILESGPQSRSAAD
jgi:hypothetical protein